MTQIKQIYTDFIFHFPFYTDKESFYIFAKKYTDDANRTI
jgi:hypothetical protein